MQQEQQKSQVVFVASDETCSVKNLRDLMYDEQRHVETTNALYITTKNLAHRLQVEKRQLYEFNKQAVVSVPREMSRDILFSTNHFSSYIPPRRRVPHQQTQGVIAPLLQNIFCTPIDAAEKKTVFIAGHGNKTDKICGMTLEHFDTTLYSLANVAKICIVLSCFAGQSEKLERIKNLNLGYPVVIACLGDVESDFNEYATAADYQQAFDKISCLNYPVQEHKSGEIFKALARMLKFNYFPTSICNVLWPGQTQFKILTKPNNHFLGYSLVGNRHVITHSKVDSPIHFSGQNDKIDFCKISNESCCSIEEIIVPDSVPLKDFSFVVEDALRWSGVHLKTQMVKVKKVRHASNKKKFKTIAVKLCNYKYTKVMHDRTQEE